MRTLLDNTVRYSGRGALFVIKAGAATGWQGRGFTKDGDDTIKDFPLNVTVGVPEQALRSRMPFSGTSSDIDSEFVAQFGAPADDRVLVLPLVLKEKVAALVYADAGSEGAESWTLPQSSCWCWPPVHGWKWRRSANRQRKKNSPAMLPAKKLRVRRRRFSPLRRIPIRLLHMRPSTLRPFLKRFRFRLR